MASFQLTVIVPVLNETTALPDLFGTLAVQRGLSFEVILCDGGSTDGTRMRAASLAANAPFECRWIETQRGRGRQLNAGAAAARSETVLFLHADSRFADPGALALAKECLDERIATRGDERVAGRFCLRFRRQDTDPCLGYYFYEAKARLNRPGCIHGDQGFLLRRSFFEEAGPFDESLAYLEDDRFAQAVFQMGEWILFPAQIETSARRFEVEGLLERQTLNALLLNFNAIGWSDILRVLPDFYCTQDRSSRIDLLAFFDLIHRQLQGLPCRQRFQVWYRTGRYVRDNAWQLVFALVQRRRFRRGKAVSSEGAGSLKRFGRLFDLMTDHPPGYLAATALTWIWFFGARFRMGRKTNRSPVAARRGG